MTTAPAPAGPKVHPGCTCGKGQIRGFLCWPCFEKYDDDKPPLSRVPPP